MQRDKVALSSIIPAKCDSNIYFSSMPSEAASVHTTVYFSFPRIPLKMNLSLKWSQQINDSAKNTDLESISVAGWWRDMKDRVAYLVPSVSPIGTFPVPTGCSSALPKLVFNLKG